MIIVEIHVINSLSKKSNKVFKSHPFQILKNSGMMRHAILKIDLNLQPQDFNQTLLTKMSQHWLNYSGVDRTRLLQEKT